MPHHHGHHGHDHHHGHHHHPHQWRGWGRRRWSHRHNCWLYWCPEQCCWYQCTPTCYVPLDDETDETTED